MPEFSAIAGSAVRTHGATGGASYATVVTPHNTANTKGSYAQIVAATAFDANWLLVQFAGILLNSPHLIDVAIGAGGSEQIVLPDLFAHPPGVVGSSPSYLFPVFVPKGSRIAARAQSGAGGFGNVITSVTLVSGVMLSGGSAPAKASAYGATASSLGTNIDPGGTADVDSAWTQLTAATDRAHNWIIVSGRFGDGSISIACYFRLSIGIGGSGSEQILIPELAFSAEPTADQSFGMVVGLPCYVPAGSRLSARVRCSVNTDGDRDVWLKLYGC
jgi:hypothetical protein